MKIKDNISSMNFVVANVDVINGIISEPEPEIYRSLVLSILSKPIFSITSQIPAMTKFSY